MGGKGFMKEYLILKQIYNTCTGRTPGAHVRCVALGYGFQLFIGLHYLHFNIYIKCNENKK